MDEELQHRIIILILVVIGTFCANVVGVGHAVVDLLSQELGLEELQNFNSCLIDVVLSCGSIGGGLYIIDRSDGW
jgi:hypothetical protein